MKILTKLIKILSLIIALVILYSAIVNFAIILYSRRFIKEPDSFAGDYDCVLVLGCGVYGNTPSDMLRDRLDRAIELYKNGKAKKLLMSGDHGKQYYDEVNVMKAYALERGIPEEDLFLDHAGFSTYESMYRAKEIFRAEKIIIVTQRYHLYRALFIARRLGLDADGCEAMPNTYRYQLYNSAREYLARNKDFLFTLFKPEPTYLGEEIPISGNGKLTNG